MEFLLFIFFSLISLVFVTLGSYYYKLFSDRERDSFSRSELTDFTHIFTGELLRTFESDKDVQTSIVAYSVSLIISYLWTLIGGLFGNAHYSSEPGNYFFLSFFLFFLLFFGYPFIRSALVDESIKMNPTSFVLKFLNQETAIISGSGVAITSANLAVYGVHHEILFLFVFANMLAIFTLLIYKLSGHNFPFLPARPSDEYEFDEEEYSEEEYDY